jgi:hypothetical protein
MMSKKWMLFVTCLSGFWLRKMPLGCPKQEMFPAKTKKYKGNEWAGHPTAKRFQSIMAGAAPTNAELLAL